MIFKITAGHPVFFVTKGYPDMSKCVEKDKSNKTINVCSDKATSLVPVWSLYRTGTQALRINCLLALLQDVQLTFESK